MTDWRFGIQVHIFLYLGAVLKMCGLLGPKFYDKQVGADMVAVLRNRFFGGLHRFKAYRNFIECIASNCGVAAVEFAYVLPVMVLLYLGTTVTVIGVETNHKLATSAESIGNLTARQQAITSAELLKNYGATNWLMVPYSAKPVVMRVGSIARAKGGTEMKCWGVRIETPTNTATITADPPPSLSDMGAPAEVMPEMTSLIVVEVSYVYKPLINWFFGDITFVERYYSRPRNSTEVEKSDNQGTAKKCGIGNL